MSDPTDPLMVRFDRFHAANPHVYDQLVELAWTAYYAGQRRIGIAQLFEVLRWNRRIHTRDTEFKLNNVYRAPYARLIMERNPQLGQIFETRRSQADEAI